MLMQKGQKDIFAYFMSAVLSVISYEKEFPKYLLSEFSLLKNDTAAYSIFDARCVWNKEEIFFFFLSQ